MYAPAPERPQEEPPKKFSPVYSASAIARPRPGAAAPQKPALEPAWTREPAPSGRHNRQAPQQPRLSGAQGQLRQPGAPSGFRSNGSATTRTGQPCRPDSARQPGRDKPLRTRRPGRKPQRGSPRKASAKPGAPASGNGLKNGLRNGLQNDPRNGLENRPSERRSAPSQTAPSGPETNPGPKSRPENPGPKSRGVHLSFLTDQSSKTILGGAPAGGGT